MGSDCVAKDKGQVQTEILALEAVIGMAQNQYEQLSTCLNGVTRPLPQQPEVKIDDNPGLVPLAHRIRTCAGSLREVCDKYDELIKCLEI